MNIITQAGNTNVRRTHNKLGDMSFSAAGPRLWNDLPPGLRRPGLTFDSFIYLATEALTDSFECIGAPLYK